MCGEHGALQSVVGCDFNLQEVCQIIFILLVGKKSL